ncbi:FIMAH domain-containing protein [Haloarchaeobius baliensis]|uniref:FIMAH domain-containing protein n=1 Tax=Haloarchaeobius baliensis TaxID=1670458 RepID=UPI003F880BFF
MTHDSDPSAFAAATPARLDGDPGPVAPMEVDEKNMPIEEARCWLLNGTNRDIDIYVNYDDQPLVTDIQSLSIGPVLTLDGTVDRPYGTYTLEARDKGDPDGPVLASASVPLEEGDSYSAALHRVGQEEYQLSIFTNDYSPSEDARLVARHCAYPEEVDWEISQNGETPEIPDDPRSGTLERGEWQTATDVTESDYLFEVFVDGELVTVEVNLELEVETTYAVHIVGEPEPLDIESYEEAEDSALDEAKWLLVQAFEVVPGEDVLDTVTAPAPPTSTTDENEGIEFDCDPVDVYQSNLVEQEVSATDPDGYVTGLAIGEVDPPTDGITIVDNSVDRAQVLGDETTATLRVGPDVPDGTYDVELVANPESLNERATCTLTVDVDPVPAERLYDLVDEFQLSDDVDPDIATDLNTLAHSAGVHREEGQTTEACALLTEFLDLVGSNKGSGISEAAHDDLQAEAQSLRADMGCE